VAGERRMTSRLSAEVKAKRPSPSRGKLDVLRGEAVWLRLSLIAAVLAAVGSVIALSVKSIYVGLTPAFLAEALAQDVVNVAIVSPFWFVLVWLALRGSLRAYLLWLGVLTFTVYNYVIYAFAIPFGPLFLLWVAVLGLCLYALIGAITSFEYNAVQSFFTNRRAVTVVAFFLIITALLFSLLWLSEDVPALISGRTPQDLIERDLRTNPVHVLDFAFFLPAAIISAVFLLKRKPFGYVVAPAFMVFLILTGIPILVTPVIQAGRGQEPGWSVVVPIATLTVLSITLLWWLMSSLRRCQHGRIEVGSED
jgi:hypothetical protein